jgi:hypothetical protein
LAIALPAAALEIRRRAEVAMNAINHIRCPQVGWIGDKDYLLSRLSDILNVGYQETLDADLDLLKLELGLSEAVAIPTDSVRANRSSGPSLHSLDAEAIQNKKKWYARDYALISLGKKLVPKEGFASISRHGGRG